MSGGGSGGGSQTSTTVQQLSPEQKKILGLATPIFQNYLSQGTEGLRDLAYGGPTFAGINPNEQFAAAMLGQAATGPMQGAAQSTLGGLHFLTSGQVLDPNTNPGLTGAINAAVRPITEQFSNVMLPAIDSASVLSGGYGSNRTEMNRRLAGEAMLRQVGDTSSTMAMQGYNQGLDAMSRSLAFAPSAIQAGAIPGQTLGQVGAFERGFEQAAIQDEMQRFYNQNFFPLMIAQQIAGTAFGYPGGSTLTSTSGAGGGGNQLTGALGGAMGGAAMGTAIMPGWGTGIGAVMGGLMGLFG